MRAPRCSSPAGSRHCTTALQPPEMPLFSSLFGCYKHYMGPQSREMTCWRPKPCRAGRVSAAAGEHRGQREPSAQHGPAAGSPATPQWAGAACPPHQPLQSLCCPDLPLSHPVNPQPAPYWGSVLPPHLAATVAIMQELWSFLSPCSQGFSLYKKKSLFHCIAPHANPFQMN